MFLQIHTLTSYPAALLNRDDAGLAKRIPFGNAIRLRISSQCLKRHWRDHLTESLPIPDGLRTRLWFSREILPRIQAGLGGKEADAELLTATLIGALLKSAERLKEQDADKGEEGEAAKTKAKGKAGKAQAKAKGNGLDMKQPVLFGQPEADYLVGLAVAAYQDNGQDAQAAAKQLVELLMEAQRKKNLTALMKAAGYGAPAAGLTSALFGRFVTSDILARVDAAVHVAHALSVHEADTEVDFFTVVDDLNRADETGAAHTGDAELASGLYYLYVAVDVPLLVSNLTGCDRKGWRGQDLAPTRAVLDALLLAIAEVSPGAKLGATAPYNRAELVLLEAGDRQPRSLANAYLEALPTRGDTMQAAVDRLGAHTKALDEMYGTLAAQRRYATVKAPSTLAAGERRPSLQAASKEILDHCLPKQG
jgi:CRISPR system Cascade subunit CasC